MDKIDLLKDVDRKVKATWKLQMEGEVPVKEITNYMKVGYREFGTLSLNLIDAMVYCLIAINVKQDKEFKEALGEGYYK